MTGLLKLAAAFGAGYTVCRVIECRAQGVPLDAAFKLGSLLQSVSYLKSVQGLSAANVVPIQVTRRMPAAIADAEYS